MVALSELIDRVVLALGEQPESCLPLGGGADAEGTLRARIRAELPDAASEAVMQTESWKIARWSILPVSELEADGGRGVLALPDDFLKLHSVWVEGWERPVTTVLPQGHWLRRLQGTTWHGLKASASRPLAFFGVKGGKRVLELFPVADGGKLKEGHYLPLPEVDSSGYMDLPAASVAKTVDIAAARIRAGIT